MKLSLTKRLYTLDIARGLAAISIVFWHWQHFFYTSSGALPANFDWQRIPFYSTLPWLFEHVGILSLYFFFSLSGFVFFGLYGQSIAQGQCSARTFFIARIARLYPLHVLSLVLVTGLQCYYSWQYNDYFVFFINDLYHFLLNIFLINAWGVQEGFSFNGPIWSVSSECLFYVLFFFLARLKQSKLSSVLLLIICLICLRSYAGYLLGQLKAYALVAGFESFLWGGVSYLVTQSYLQRSLKPNITKVIFYLCASLTIFGLSSLLIIDQSTLQGIGYDLMARTLIPLSLFTLVVWEYHSQMRFKRLAWLGDITYSVYLLHFPLQLLCEMFRRQLGLGHELYSSVGFMLLFFMLLIPTSYASYVYVEAPLRKWIRLRYS